MGTVAIRTDRTDLSASAVYGIYKQRQAVEQFFKTYGDTLGMDATWMRSDEAAEGLLFLNHLSAVIATDILEAISAAGHSPRRELQGLHPDAEEGQGMQDVRRRLAGSACAEEGRGALREAGDRPF
jgi:hypothetical protein